MNEGLNPIDQEFMKENGIVSSAIGKITMRLDETYTDDFLNCQHFFSARLNNSQ